MTATTENYELSFWSDCLNTFGEERKHYVYAGLMGVAGPRANGTTVIDIGGGPVSMLLKCGDRGARCAVADPLLDEFPEWVRDRYRAARIAMLPKRGEDLTVHGYDEAWIYNVLQHVDDPELVIANARAAAPVIRLFEWIGIPAYDGHPHELDQASLERWLGGRGRVVSLSSEGCYGVSFSGVFGG